MDFRFLFGIAASIILFLKTTVFLAVSPYKTMRKIAQSDDLIQPLIIFFLIGTYFIYSSQIRTGIYSPLFLFGLTVVNFILTITFFALIKLLSAEKREVHIRKFIILFSYSLIPTLIWFTVNSVLYVLLPPPRTPSFLGKGFSIVYTAFSIAVLIWKVMVTYLAVRYSTELKFFRIIYSFILYLVAAIPYSLILYSAKIFRIPFL